MTVDICTAQPREQAGPQTGARYEYQYQQAALACLEILRDDDSHCVFCEWHDDFVVESGDPEPTVYCFHQVKSRKLSEGPWTLGQVFGLPRKKRKPEAAHHDSVFARLCELAALFDSRCKEFVLVTNAAIADDVATFLQACRAASQPGGLDPANKEIFDRLCIHYQLLNGQYVADWLLGNLRRFTIFDEVGSIKDLNVNYLTLTNRLFELSEVDLSHAEGKKIGKELVDLVRRKSHHVLDPMPQDTSIVRAEKSITGEDVLNVLSLSPGGYRALQESDGPTLKALSLLHRLCRDSGVSEDLIPVICSLKAEWDAWYRNQRHRLNQADYMALYLECATLLEAHSKGSLSIRDLAQAAADLAGTTNQAIQVTPGLTRDLVLGLVFAIAAKTGSPR